MHKAGWYRPMQGLLLACSSLLLTMQTQAQEVAPSGKTVLRISGKLPEASKPTPKVVRPGTAGGILPQHSFTTHTPWQDKPARFTGPLLRDVLASVKAHGSQLKGDRAQRLQGQHPVSDTQRFDMVLALRVNGERISVRKQGPSVRGLPLRQPLRSCAARPITAVRSGSSKGIEVE